MGRRPLANVIPWSYSSLTSYETCPRRHKILKIDKLIKEAQTEAILWGNRVHKELELAVADGKPLGPEYVQYQGIVSKVMSAPGEKFAERKFALTASFKPTEFFAADAWMRGVIDLTVVNGKTAAVVDWKTGKVKTDGDQLKLFAAAGFAIYPEVNTVNTGYAWLAANTVTTKRFTRDEVPVIWQEFIPRVARMEAAVENDNWPPKPSGLCKNYCPVGRRLCSHCGKD